MKEKSTITEAFFVEGASISWKRGIVESYEVAGSSGVLEALEGEQSYQKGDYIMSGPEGEKYSMPPEKFVELKDDLGEGSASPKRILKVSKLATEDGVVMTQWGVSMEYRAGKDHIVRHAKGDYGVVKAEIFEKTYESFPPVPTPKSSEKPVETGFSLPLPTHLPPLSPPSSHVKRGGVSTL